MKKSKTAQNLDDLVSYYLLIFPILFSTSNKDMTTSWHLLLYHLYLDNVLLSYALT